MAKKKILIKWGQYVQGYGFGALPNYRSSKWHLVKWEAHNSVAVCGTGVSWDSSSFCNGWLCDACAKELHIASADDFDVDDEEYTFGLANFKQEG